eukprot:g13910.t1
MRVFQRLRSMGICSTYAFNDRLIDAALWNGEWSRGVGLLKDLVDLGIPVDVTKHRRLLQDMKEFFSGKDGALGIAAEVIRDDGERYQTSVEVSRVSSVQIPLHAFAASFSPHWLDGEARSQVSVEMCMRMLREESSESFDAASAYDVMHSYYHCTLHRRAVVPVDLPDGQLLRVLLVTLNMFGPIACWKEQLQESSRTEFAARWDTWLKAHGLERLLRHDGQRLRLDGTNGARPARAEVTAFQVRSSGQVDLELYSGSISNFKKCKHVHGSRWIFCCFAHVQIFVPGRVPVLGEYGGLGYAVEGHRWSQHHEWGYGEKEVNRNPEVFADGLERLMGRLLRAICAGGVAGAIYTQWTDVETEVNGLLTYDRAWMKAIRSWLRSRRLQTEEPVGFAKSVGFAFAILGGLATQEARRASKSAPAQVNEKQEGPEGEMLEEDLGTFWMRFSNFCEAFSTVQVSEYRPGYVSTLCHLKPTASQVAVSVDLPLDDQKEMEAVISVIQESDEAFTRNQRKKYSAVRLELFEPPGTTAATAVATGLEQGRGSPSSWTRGARHVASSSFATQRETVLRVAMKTGTNYLVVVHWLQAQPPQSWNSDATFRVYAPRPVSLEDAAVRGFADLAQREAYEAAAFGPRGVCLKEQGGVQLRCWSDRDSGTIALVFDATVAPAGLMASIHWRLQMPGIGPWNANLQPSFPDEGSLKAKGVQEHVQQVELKPGQRQLTLVSWLDPATAFSASYSWQAATDPCAECGLPVGAAVPGRFSGAYRKMERHAVHEESGWGGQLHLDSLYVTFSGTLLEYDLASEKAQAAFEGAFSVLRFREQCDAVDLPLLVGLDFEWKPDKAGSDNPIALMQFACWDTVLLLQTVGAAELPGWLRAFLESGEEILKVVASFDLADKRKLKNSFGWDFEEQAVKASYWDIAELAGAQGLPQGMLKMAQYFELPLQKLKSVGTSNWSAELTLEQRRYAADDAFFQLYLLGRLLPSARSDSRSMQASWSAIREELERNIKKVDNSKYKANFMALRAVLLDAGSDSEDQEEEVLETEELILKVQELLVAYKPPIGKKPSALREVLWVPARAILSKSQIASLESCRSDCIETSYDSEDGLLLRLARHPRAPDDHKHLELSVHSLSELSQIDPAEAKSRLTADEKFMQSWSRLRVVEANSDEERNSTNLRC